MGADIQDGNDDGLLDLVSHFRISATGIESGGVEAYLKGQMLDLTPFSGCDRVSTASKQKKN